MRTKFYLDKRGGVSHDLEQVWPIKIAINHKGSSAYIATGVCVAASQWESKPSPGRVIGSGRAARLNIVLTEKKLAVDKIIEELRLAGQLHGASASDIKRAVDRELAIRAYGTADGELPIVACFERFIATKTRQGTKDVYRATQRKLQEWDGCGEVATFHAVTYNWLTGLEAHLGKTLASANARAIHLRNVRAVMNYALEEELTDAAYPFKRFKIRGEVTADRSLSVEELRRLHDVPCSASLEKYRDLFFLSFYLCGINLGDLLEVRAMKGDRIEVRRIKTGQPVSVKVEPEALAIINKYRGRERLIAVTASTDYKSFRHRLNNYLKRIGTTYNPRSKRWEGEAVCPNISYYYARYSWATIAAELDVPERTIGAALGHSTSKSVTSIYTRVDMRKKVDVANRAVIDKVFCEDLHNRKI